MIAHFTKHAAPLAALALGVGLSGCNVSVNWDDVDGVAFSEFDQSGDAPDAISMSGVDEVIITDGESFSMTLEGDEDAQDALRFDRSGDELRIGRDSGIYSGNGKAIVRITMPAPSALSTSGTSSIQSEVMASDAEIDTSGTSSISVIKLESDSLDLDMSGASQVTAAGSVERLIIDLSGSTSASLRELLAYDVKADLSGASSATLSSNGIVEADLSGASKVTVIGSAKCSGDTSGASSLDCGPAD